MLVSATAYESFSSIILGGALQHAGVDDCV